MNNFPEAMKQAPNWCIWVFGEGTGHDRKKIPYNPITRQKARANNPDDWVSYAVASHIYEHAKRPDQCGLGFLISDGWGFLDRDGIKEDIDKYVNYHTATSVVQTLKDVRGSYSEISSSGEGMHSIFKIAGTPNVEGTKTPNSLRPKLGNNELYCGKRFVALTGNYKPLQANNSIKTLSAAEFEQLHAKYIGKSTPVRENKDNSITGGGNGLTDEQVIDIACRSKNGERFRNLYVDGVGDYWLSDANGKTNFDQSAADLALLDDLAYYTAKDPQQMDRLFRKSALMRPKWDKKHYSNGMTYGEHSIQVAIDSTPNSYQPRKLRKYTFNFGLPDDIG